MDRLPEDLLQYLRSNKLDENQKRLIRELAVDTKQIPRTAGEYAAMYARRARRIRGITT